MEEIEDRNQVIAMGIDKKGKEFELTIQMPVPINIVGGKAGGGGGKAVETFSETGSSLTQMIAKLQEQVNRRLFLGHLRVVIFGEDVAKDGVYRFLDLLMRTPDVSRKVKMVTTSGKAKDILNHPIEMDKINSTFIDSMIQTGITFKSMTSTILADLVSDIENKKRQPILNELVMNKKGYRWVGISLFKKDRKIGRLNTIEATPLLQIREQKFGDPIKINCSTGAGEKGTIEFRPIDIEKDISVIKNRMVRIAIEIEGEIVEKTCNLNLSKRQTIPRIEQKIRSKYHELARRVINRAQRQYQTDIFNLGAHVYAFHPGFYRQHNWSHNFANIPIQLVYKIHIRRFGLDS
ncbi:Ger(x)C family spore germination protein [Seinonella peptonophila]|nr:Ger(x)C family spore germination protein [Seinonella peptonophila]